METVIETAVFQKNADKAGMTEAEVTAAITQISGDPKGGEVVQGSNGCRKVRVAGKGKGTSGGYRVMTIHPGPKAPVYMLAVLSKGNKGNFSKEEIAKMAKLARMLKDIYGGADE